MLNVFAEDLSDFVSSELPLLSFPAVPPTESAPPSSDPFDLLGDADKSVFKVVLLEVAGGEVGTKSFVGANVVEVVTIVVVTIVVAGVVLDCISIIH